MAGAQAKFEGNQSPPQLHLGTVPKRVKIPRKELVATLPALLHKENPIRRYCKAKKQTINLQISEP